MLKKTISAKTLNIISKCDAVESYLIEIYEKFKEYFDHVTYGIDFHQPFLVEPLLPKNTIMVCCKIPSSIIHDSDCLLILSDGESSFEGRPPSEAEKVSITLNPWNTPKIHYIRKCNLLSISDERNRLEHKEIDLIMDMLSDILEVIGPAKVNCRSIIDVTIGTDPEFELLFPSGDFATARSLRIPLGWEIGHDTSGNQLEVRPRPSINPGIVVDRVWMLLNDVMAEKKNVVPCVSGHKYPLGGHIHIGHPFINTDLFPEEKVIELIDDFMGDLVELSGKARSIFKKRKSYRTKPYGVEYRTLPSVIFYSKHIATITLTIIKKLSQLLLDGKEISYHIPPSPGEISEIIGIEEAELNGYFRELKRLREDIAGERNIIVSDIDLDHWISMK